MHSVSCEFLYFKSIEVCKLKRASASPSGLHTGVAAVLRATASKQRLLLNLRHSKVLLGTVRCFGGLSNRIVLQITLIRA